MGKLAVKSRLFFVIFLLMGLSISWVLTPTTSKAATTEPIHVNVYIYNTIAVMNQYDKWQVRVVRTVDGATSSYPLDQMNSTGDPVHFLINKNYPDPSDNWSVRVIGTCRLVNGSPVVSGCKTYDHSTAPGTLYTSSAFNVKGTDFEWVGTGVPRPNPTAAPATPNTTPSTTVHAIYGKLQSYSSTGTTRYRINPDKAGDASLSLGRSINNTTWDPMPKSSDYNKTYYTCKYKGTPTAPQERSCKKGTTAPANSTMVPNPGSPEAVTAETNALIEANIELTKSNGINVPTKGCENGKTYTKGILAGVPCNAPIKTLDQALLVIQNIMNQMLVPSAATLFTIMIIVGGIMYIASNGNEQRATKAKSIITAAIIGLLITILAYVIVALFAGAIGGGVIA